LSAAKALAAMGLRVCIADCDAERRDHAAAAVDSVAKGAGRRVLPMDVDVTDRSSMEQLREAVLGSFGRVNVLMNNAGIQPGTSLFSVDGWARVLDVNFWGVLHGIQTFAPSMIASGAPAMIVNTGSKQGITTPPGDPGYNVSKAAVKVLTEALAHELRNLSGHRVSAHLFVPGFVFTPLTARGREQIPPEAWTPEQAITYMVERLSAGDFYIICPDNEVTPPLDQARILWAAGDIVHNRPALSRWHPDYQEQFKAFLDRRNLEKASP
jgi:NAD(P)-dependent dehydrogenase (short-subunit alcohol dehydrogenase family)